MSEVKVTVFAGDPLFAGQILGVEVEDATTGTAEEALVIFEWRDGDRVIGRAFYASGMFKRAPSDLRSWRSPMTLYAKRGHDWHHVRDYPSNDENRVVTWTEPRPYV